MTTLPAAKDIKFIYWFAYYNCLSPSVRYRGKYPLQHLKRQHGIDSCFVVPGYHPKKILRFIYAYASALFFPRSGSLVVIQRVHSNFIYSNFLKVLVMFRKESVAYDLDDADYLEYPPKNIHWFIRNCRLVFVGSHELAQNLRWLNSNIIVNTSPTPDLKITNGHKNNVLNIGWIGCFGGGHKRSLISDFFPALKNLPFPVKLTLLGVDKASEYRFLKHYFGNDKNINLEIPQAIDWENESSIQEEITKFDIGIATLIDDELHRSKSAFKAKQYLNNGVPVLSADLPENNRFVKSGINGFLCSSPEEFREKLITFNSMNRKEYSKISTAARNSVPDFDIPRYCYTFLSSFNVSVSKAGYISPISGFVQKSSHL